MLIFFSFSDTLSPIEKPIILHQRNIHNYNSIHIRYSYNIEH